MFKTKFRDLFPSHILLMILCLIFFSVILHSESAALSAREQGLIKALMYVAGVFISIHFILKALWRVYLSGKVSSSEPSSDKAKKEASFKDLVEKAAPRGYKLEVSLNAGFSFCYPESWQVVRSKEKLLYMQIKETNLEQGMTILRNFNVSYQNIEGIPNTDFLFKMIINGLVKAMDATLEFKEPFRTEETFGMRYKLKYNNPKRTDLCCYQIAITNSEKKSLILLTFTSGVRDFPKTQKLFNDIADLVKIF